MSGLRWWTVLAVVLGLHWGTLDTETFNTGNLPELGIGMRAAQWDGTGSQLELGCGSHCATNIVVAGCGVGFTGARWAAIDAGLH